MELVSTKGVERESFALIDWELVHACSGNEWGSGSSSGHFGKVGFGKVNVGRGGGVVCEEGSGYGVFREVWFGKVGVGMGATVVTCLVRLVG